MNIDWANTPGGYYAVAYWLSCCMIIRNSPRSRERKKSIVMVTVLGVILYLLMHVTHGTSRWLFIPFMILFFYIIWTAIYYVCRYDVKTAMYFTARAFIIGEFIASLEWGVFYYLVKYAKIPLTMQTNVLLLVLVDGFLIFIFHKLEQKNRKVNSNLQITWQELVSAGIITLAIFAVSNLSFVLEHTIMSEAFVSELFTVRTLVDLGGVAILYAYHVQLGELQMRFEVERLQGMLDMQYNNYEMLEKSIAAVNQKYHDLKYQISVLKTEAGAKESIAYLDQMEQEIKSYEAQNKTGNKVLDTILTAKTLYCHSNWIELTSVVDGEALGFMNPMDISTLFGNMLDNAIESVMKIEKKEKRLIHLTVATQKKFLRIRMENCYEDELQFENGLPATTKADTKYHGFGLKSIQSTAKKYGGSVTIHAENGWFEVRILIPLPLPGRQKTSG